MSNLELNYIKYAVIDRGVSDRMIDSIYKMLIKRTHSSAKSFLNRNLATLLCFPKISQKISLILVKLDFKII